MHQLFERGDEHSEVVIMKVACLLKIATAGGLLSLSLLASELTGRPSPPLTQGRQQGAPQADTRQKQKFEGKILRASDRLILEDKADKVIYQLDDQQLAQLFEGKEVKVTGSLDPESNTISISDIALSKPTPSA